MLLIRGNSAVVTRDFMNKMELFTTMLGMKRLRNFNSIESMLAATAVTVVFVTHTYHVETGNL